MKVSNGNFIDEEGNVINIVQLLRNGEATPIVGDDGHYMRAHSGWYTDENGVPVNLITLLESGVSGNSGVSDVQVDGTSVVSDGVAEIPIAGSSRLGAVKTKASLGISINGSGELMLSTMTLNIIKSGSDLYYAVSPGNQHQATFYGLAKVAGHDEKSSTLPVGQYTEEAKSAISDMLNGAVQVTGTTPTITALSGVRYVCGEVATLDITPCASGICDIVFTSGSTATVLTLPNTVKFPDGAFTPEANTTYELNIMDGIYGAVMAWT